MPSFSAQISTSAQRPKADQYPWEDAWKAVWWRLLQHGVVGAGGHGWPMKKGTACPCGRQHATASRPCATQAQQLREHVFWNCTGALAIRLATQRNLSEGVIAFAATACVTDRTALPISEKGVLVCCLLCGSNRYVNI